MKKILLIVFILFGAFATQAQDINWMSLDDALAKQKRNPKPIFMNIYTVWCEPCRMMDNGTFNDPAVVDYISKNYYAVKFNAEGSEKVNLLGSSFSNPGFDPSRRGRNSAHELTKRLKVPGYPTMYIIDIRGNIKETIEGPKEPDALLRALKR